MRAIETATGIVWLSTQEFAAKQYKSANTIRQWCKSGFVVELGYILQRDPTGHWQIGIPPQHQSYHQFA